jgi:hypothetical protein
MSHDDIQSCITQYAKFKNMMPGTFLKFSNNVEYYCTRDNDTPYIISKELAKKLGLDANQRLISSVCDSLLKNHYNKNNFRVLSSRSKFKECSMAQFDPELCRKCSSDAIGSNDSIDSISSAQSMAGDSDCYAADSSFLE